MNSRDARCVRFLQWALPQLGLRWSGFRRVRGQVCKRLYRRAAQLGLALEDYRGCLERVPDEWDRLDAMCRVTISRFYRDRLVFDRLGREILPDLARAALAEGRALRAWSAGCASGEEPYTLALVWSFRVQPTLPSAAIDILATDSDPVLLGRARVACYEPSSLKAVPAEWNRQAFEPGDGLRCLKPGWKGAVRFRAHDVRTALNEPPFALILCRNLVFTYFAEHLQREIAERLRMQLLSGGVLVLGAHEKLPAAVAGFESVMPHLPIYRRSDTNA